MRNGKPSRYKIKQTIRRLARKTGLTMAQVRPAITSHPQPRIVVNLVWRTWKFQKQTAENIHLQHPFLVIDRGVWLAIPYSRPIFIYSKYGPSSPQILQSWETFHEMLPQYPENVHVQ